MFLKSVGCAKLDCPRKFDFSGFGVEAEYLRFVIRHFDSDAGCPRTIL